MELNIKVDVMDNVLRARQVIRPVDEPDVRYDFNGVLVDVWVDATHVDPEDVEDIVWMSVMKLDPSW